MHGIRQGVWWRWLLANLAGVGVLLAPALLFYLAALLGGVDPQAAAPREPEAGPQLSRRAVVTMTLAAGALFGLTLGFFQWWLVLRRHLPRLRLGGWLGATVPGSALSFALGVLLSGRLAAPVAFGLGGLVLGVAQWGALRRHLVAAWSWIAAQALLGAAGPIVPDALWFVVGSALLGLLLARLIYRTPVIASSVSGTRP